MTSEPTKRVRRARLTIEMGTRIRAQAIRTKIKAQLSSLSELVHRAIVFYRWVQENTPEDGGTLEVLAPDGETKAKVPLEFL